MHLLECQLLLLPLHILFLYSWNILYNISSLSGKWNTKHKDRSLRLRAWDPGLG